MNSLIVIPSRYESSRFPGKPLRKIAGVSLIERVYRQCESSNADDIIVATDDQRIFNHVTDFGGNAVMTSVKLTNGTERVIEACEQIIDENDEYDVIINVQGDEPLIDPEDINRIIDMFDQEETDIATLISRITTNEELFDHNVVKAVVTDFEDGIADALYFSRSPIPYQRDTPESEWLDKNAYFRHVGLYGFSAEALASIKWLKESDLEKAEKLEQLRWLQNHFVVSVSRTTNKPLGVDTPEDVVVVEKVLKSTTS